MKREPSRVNSGILVFKLSAHCLLPQIVLAMFFIEDKFCETLTGTFESAHTRIDLFLLTQY
jgi:hypothetical protein